MGFFKPADEAASSKRLARVDVLTWVLIYAGLFTVVMGFALTSYDTVWSGLLISMGATLVALGAVLIYLRSRIKD
jgi:vacuolar-type H+-ATPase subunit I/STV1